MIEIIKLDKNELGCVVYFKYQGPNVTSKCRWIDLTTNLNLYATTFELHENVEYYIGLPISMVKHVSNTRLVFDGDIGDFNFILFDKVIPYTFLGHDFKLKTLDSDSPYFTFIEVKVLELYDSENVKVLPGDVVVDIGANYGMFTQYAVEKGAKRVISVEPYKPVFDCLKDNISGLPNVELINCGIYDCEGVADFSISESSAVNSILGTLSNESENTVKVFTTTINKLISDYQLTTIDYLKVDCEGCELDLFTTITDDNLLKCKKIVVEYHKKIIGIFIQEKLKKLGYKFDNLADISDAGLIYAYL